MHPEVDQVIELVRLHVPDVEILSSRALHPGDRPVWWFRWPGSLSEVQLDSSLVLIPTLSDSHGTTTGEEFVASDPAAAATYILEFLESTA